MISSETIVALASPAGAGAIAVIRVSGLEAITICAPLFRSIHGKDLNKQKTHTIHLGHIIDGDRVLDEVLVSIFKNNSSYTGESTIEISCHGSPYIQQEIIQLLTRKGCRTAQPGEFTLRAFINGKMDLSQAEAVADLISSDNAASHQLAIQQMRGGFSNEIQELRAELMNFASLIELELDFAEEDVAFADREQFKNLLTKIASVLKRLIDSFATGSVIKNGIPVAIVGEPNVGKSTLLNAFLNEERAIVSDIAGTTRDTIEDELTINGIGFRFIDTAGIRETKDVVESIGIQKTFEKIEQAQVIIYLLDSASLLDLKYMNDHKSRITTFSNQTRIQQSIVEINKLRNKFPQTPLVVVPNKIDGVPVSLIEQLTIQLQKIEGAQLMPISAKKGTGIDELKELLVSFINTGVLRNNETIVTNTRHYDALIKALEEIQKVQYGLQTGLSGDLMAIDIRQALYHFGEITGEITSDDLLGNIFANFCIGK